MMWNTSVSQEYAKIRIRYKKLNEKYESRSITKTSHEIAIEKSSQGLYTKDLGEKTLSKEVRHINWTFEFLQEYKTTTTKKDGNRRKFWGVMRCYFFYRALYRESARETRLYTSPLFDFIHEIKFSVHVHGACYGGYRYFSS